MLYRISVTERGLTGIANIFRSRLSRLDDLLGAGTVPLMIGIMSTIIIEQGSAPCIRKALKHRQSKATKRYEAWTMCSTESPSGPLTFPFFSFKIAFLTSSTVAPTLVMSSCV